MGCLNSKSKTIEDVSKEQRNIMPVVKEFKPLENSLKKYKIKGIISKRQLSSILRVEDKRSCIPYAVRIFSMKNYSYWQKEILVLRRTKHQNIIRLFETFDHNGKKFLVIELATGGTLYDRLLANKKFTDYYAANILRKVLSALYYLHQLGIGHRDVNPKNIMFSHLGVDANILLTNFRSSCHSHPSKLMSGIFGKPAYAAPEMKNGELYSKSVDIWSVGIIMCQFFMKKLPIDDENIDFSPVLWKNHSKYTLPFLKKLLVVDPTYRYSAEQSLTDKYIKFVSIKSENITPPGSISSLTTNTVSKSSASWRVSVYST